MSYDIERKVIANHLQANSFYGLTPFGLDGEPVDLVAGGGFIHTLNGEGRAASTGAPGANRHEYVGVMMLTIVTEGGAGSSAGLALADTVITGFTGLKLDEDGGTPDTSSTVVIDFAQRGFAPYVSASRQEAPFHRTTINIPFIRTERK